MEELETEPERIDPEGKWQEDSPPDPSLLGAMWRGMCVGFRWISFIIGPFVGIMLIAGLVLIEFSLGSGRGFGVPDFALGAIGAYLVMLAFGCITGALISLIGALAGRGRPGTRRASWWSSANRPIRLLQGRRESPPPSRNEAVPPKPVWRQWPFWLGVPIQLAMTAAFLAGIYLGREVDHRLAEARAAADQDDPYWRLEDLLANRDPVPYEENSAIVVAEVLSLMPKAWPYHDDTPPGMPRPPSTEPSRAYDRMSAHPVNVRLDEETAETLRRELDHYREALQIARTLMYYDQGRHELEISFTVIDTPLEETQVTRTLARLLAADSAILAHDGDLDGALDSCRALLGAGRSIGDEPFLVAQMIRSAMGAVSAVAARRVLGQGEPSDAALARLQALFLDELDQPLLLYGVRGERAALIELIRRIRDGEVPISALGAGERRPDNPLGLRSTIAPWGKLMFDNQMAVALEWLNQAVDIASRPPAERPALWNALDDEIKRVRATPFSSYTSALPVFLMPFISPGSAGQSRSQAELGATIILLAAERYRRKTGAWPVSVEDIDSEILPEPPIDPFSGQPYHMERRDGRLFVYSIGPNGRDEHGAFDVKQYGKGQFDDFGAIGWDVDRRRQSPTADDEPDEDRPPAGSSGQ